jgi:class 3 adenylate cyclase
MAEDAGRKLAAIMFTDMVGYSALAQRNESLALGSRAVHQRRPVRGRVRRRGGVRQSPRWLRSFSVLAA